MRLAEKVGQAQRESADRDERTRLAGLVFDWSALAWRAEPPSTLDEQTRVSAMRSKWSVALSQSDQPGASDLQDVLWALSNSSPKLDPMAWAYLAGGYHSLTEDLVAQWLKAPRDATGLRELLADRGAAYIKEAVRRQSESRS